MTVKELIEILDQLPDDAPVVVDGNEATEVLIREEIYFSEEFDYHEGIIVKIY